MKLHHYQGFGRCISESNSSATRRNGFSWLTFRTARTVEVEKIARTIPEYVTAQPRGSGLRLADFTGALFNEEALRAIKQLLCAA